MEVHDTAEVAATAHIGQGTKVWHFAQVRERASIGNNCIIGKGVYVDVDVVIGNNVKIQNSALIYRGVVIEDGVFIGPQACLTNDRFPRSVTHGGQLKRDSDWELGRIVVRYGASVGAGAIILPNVVIGQFALVGAGAVVTKDVAAHGLVVGNPARLTGYVCSCGAPLVKRGATNWRCETCGLEHELHKLLDSEV